MANANTDSSSSSSSSAGATPDQAVPIAPAAYDDHTNFFRSATPRRIMYFEGDSWIAFEDDLVFSLVEGFRTGRSEVMISLDSVEHLFDYLAMSLIEPKSGTRRPVAWFDEEGMCFFPSNHSDGMGLTAPPLDEAVAESALVGVPLMKVERGRADYEAVKGLFLEGLGTFMMFVTVFGIFQHVPARESGWAWWRAFEESVESTRRQRGAANVRRGWIGCSRERMGEILMNGFGRGGGSSSNRAGVICLSAEDYSYMSLKSCDVDDDGLHYMLLCRIIMGNMEEMQSGNQFRPRQENFDSAVDNLEKPKCYMIWSSQTKANIYPEFVISFKLAPYIRDYFAGLKEESIHRRVLVARNERPAPPMQRVIPDRALRTGNRPRSPWMSIPALLSAIENQITPATRAALDLHHDAFKRGEISRHEFIRRMRNLTGDRLLSTTIMRFFGND